MNKDFIRLIAGILLVLAFCPLAFSQGLQQQHIEIEVADELGRDYRVLPLEEDGLIVLHNSSKVERTVRELRLTYYDTTLQLLWTKVYLVPQNTRVVGHAYDEKTLYILISEKEFKYDVLSFDLTNGVGTKITYRNLDDFTVSFFEVAGDTFIFGGMVRNTPAVILYNHKFEELNVLPSINQLKASIQAIHVDKPRNVVAVVLVGNQASKGDGYYINTYNFGARLMHNTYLPPSREFTLINFYPTFGQAENEVYIVGTWSKSRTDFSQGVYALKLYDGRLDILKLHDFSTFRNFFNYLEPSKRNRLLQKIARKQERGKRKNFQYNLLVHPMKQRDGQFILTAESVELNIERRNIRNLTFDRNTLLQDPAYSRLLQNTNESRSQRGEFIPSGLANYIVRPHRVLPDEFRYIHAFSCALDEAGDLVWDNVFPLDRRNQFHPIEYMQTVFGTDSVVFIQPDGDIIRYTVASRNAWNEQIQQDTVRSLQGGGKVLDYFEHGGTMRWYGDVMLYSGLRTLRNKNAFSADKEMFFLSRLRYAWTNREE